MIEKSKTLTDTEVEVYSRQIVLRDIGYEGQLKLKNATVAVAGLGGLGSPAAIQLAAMGVGTIRLVDRDVVELSNLHRQHLYGVEDVGLPKVEAAARHLRQMNPNIEIEVYPFSINSNTANEIVRGANVVVDGLDRIETRYAVNRACVKLDIPYIYGAAIEAFGNVTTIIPGETPCLECFLPNFNDDVLPTCAIAGVHPSILGIVASLEVSEAVKLIIGEKPSLAGHLLYCDIRDVGFDKVQIARELTCPVCGQEPRSLPTPLREQFVEEICGRSGKRTHVITPKENLAISMDALQSVLENGGRKVKVKGDHGINFIYDNKVSVSILSSGIMVAEGAENEKQAQEIYEDLIMRGLGVAGTRIR